MVTGSKSFIFLWSTVWTILSHISVPAISSPDYNNNDWLSNLLYGAPRQQNVEDVTKLSPTTNNPGFEAPHRGLNINSRMIMRSRYDKDELYQDEESDSSYSESYEDNNNYWEYCKICDHSYKHGYGHKSHHTYPFIVLITINKCHYPDSSGTSEEYPASETFGTGFIVSPHCVITTASLVSLEYHDQDCLNITVSFCQSCSAKPYHKLDAFNRTIIVKGKEEDSYTTDNSCVLHSDYDNITLVYNIAILKFKEAIPFDCAKPACWNDMKSEPEWYYPELSHFHVQICGFGAVNEDDYRSSCQHCISCRQGSQQHCSQAVQQDNEEITPYHDTCALCPEYQPMCLGGTSSVILHTPLSNRLYGCPTVIGIASWTVPNCMKARPVVYCSTLLKKTSQFIKMHCNCLPIPPPSTNDDY